MSGINGGFVVSALARIRDIAMLFAIGLVYWAVVACVACFMAGAERVLGVHTVVTTCNQQCLTMA